MTTLFKKLSFEQFCAESFSLINVNIYDYLILGLIIYSKIISDFY